MTAQSYHSGFHYSPWWEGISSHIWHNRSDKLSVAFPVCVEKKKKTACASDDGKEA